MTSDAAFSSLFGAFADPSGEVCAPPGEVTRRQYNAVMAPINLKYKGFFISSATSPPVARHFSSGSEHFQVEPTCAESAIYLIPHT